MKFLADENIESRLVQKLQDDGYDVTWVRKLYPGRSDLTVFKIAQSQHRILLTNDKDFGEICFLQKKIPEGIILIRTNSEDSSFKAKLLSDFIRSHKEKIKGHFSVIAEKGVRLRKI